MNKNRSRGHDPAQDTERLYWAHLASESTDVAEVSIRLRILKAIILSLVRRGTDLVAEVSIRLKILKESHSHIEQIVKVK